MKRKHDPQQAECHSTVDVLVAVVTADAPVWERSLEDQGRMRGKGHSVVVHHERGMNQGDTAVLCAGLCIST